MSTDIVPRPRPKPLPPDPPIHLVETDGEPLDSPWHRDCVNILIDSVESHRHGRKDFFCGGNMFIYFSAEQARNRDFRSPDFFVVNGADHDRTRLYWAAWDEDGCFPDLIVELTSPSTAREDRTTKFEIYERTFQTPEYYLYDPDSRVLEAWHLANGDAEEPRYQRAKPDDHGRFFSPSLGLWMGLWTGFHLGRTDVWLRLFDEGGSVVPTYVERAEGEAAVERQRALTERQRAEAERLVARAERQRAEAERKRAEAEQLRAVSAEAEVARLRAELAALRAKPHPE